MKTLSKTTISVLVPKITFGFFLPRNGLVAIGDRTED